MRKRGIAIGGKIRFKERSWRNGNRAHLRATAAAQSTGVTFTTPPYYYTRQTIKPEPDPAKPTALLLGKWSDSGHYFSSTVYRGHLHYTAILLY